MVFGDWAESALAMEPAVYLRGLPPSLNLKTQPAGGWPVTVVAGATEDLGQLRASIALTRTNDNTPVPDAQVDFTAAVSGAGEQPSSLKITLPIGLRPGSYEGLISFATDRPSTGRKVRLPSPLPASLNLARPAAQIADAAVDFGTVLFDTSPNFRVNETAYVPLAFDDSPFNLTPEPIGSSCPGLELVAGPPEMRGQAYRLPLTLRSSGPIAPQTCSGTLALRGPSEDYDVNPEIPLSWRLVIPAVEWEILGVRQGQGGASASDANMGSLGRPGERKGATLLVRYTGKPPFSLQLSDLNGTAEGAGVAVGRDDLDLVAAPAVQQAGASDEYQVPIELLVRRSLSQASPLARWLSGTDYSGRLKIQVAGLPASQSQEVSFRLHNPSLYQRHRPTFLPVVVARRRDDSAVSSDSAAAARLYFETQKGRQCRAPDAPVRSSNAGGRVRIVRCAAPAYCGDTECWSAQGDHDGTQPQAVRRVWEQGISHPPAPGAAGRNQEGRRDARFGANQVAHARVRSPAPSTGRDFAADTFKVIAGSRDEPNVRT